MWLCPQCGAWNIGVGPCQCCGHGRQEVVSGIDTTATLYHHLHIQ